MNWFFICAGGIVLLLLVELGLRLHVDKYAAPLLAWYRQAAPQGGQIKDDYFLPNSIIWLYGGEGDIGVRGRWSGWCGSRGRWRKTRIPGHMITRCCGRMC